MTLKLMMSDVHIGLSSALRMPVRDVYSVCESWLTLYVEYSVQSDLSGFWGALQVAGVF